MSLFEHAWSRFHRGYFPVGYRLLADGAPNWVRFHSLPESKRYAHKGAERTILLGRQNGLAEAVLGPAPCWLVQTHWTTPPGYVDHADAHDPFRATRDWSLQFSFDFIDMEEDEEDRTPWKVYAAKTNWVAGRFDDLLLSIGAETAGPTLWMSDRDGAIFAPYDGGIDLFLPAARKVTRLRKRHRDWLSAHPLGL